MHRRLITNAVGKDGKKRVHSRVGQHHGTLRSCHYREAASLLEYDKSSQLAFMPTSCEAVGSLELLEDSIKHLHQQLDTCLHLLPVGVEFHFEETDLQGSLLKQVC